MMVIAYKIQNERYLIDITVLFLIAIPYNISINMIIIVQNV